MRGRVDIYVLRIRFIAAASVADRNHTDFIRRIGVELGPDIFEQMTSATRDVAGYRRDIPAVVLPGNRQQVETTINIARECRVPLYPISRGCNWGLGSRLPARNGCVIVDLKRMSRIISIDEKFGYAVIEPGVTQYQLSEHLRQARSRFYVDVTGSARESSIVGNTLERGTSYNGMRPDNLVNLEIVLGSGRTVRTGFSHFEASRTKNLFPYGIGPDLTGSFVQSNFGIVTSMTVKLLLKPDYHTSVSVAVPKPCLSQLIDALRDLRQDGTIDCVVHLCDQRRGEISFSPILYEKIKEYCGYTPTRTEIESTVRGMTNDGWSAVFCLSGPASVVREKKRLVKKRFKSMGTIKYIDAQRLATIKKICSLLRLRKKLALVAAYEELYGMTRGIPTDEALRSIYWPHRTEEAHWKQPDLGESGILFAVPVIPMDGESALHLIDIVDAVKLEYKFDYAMTLNTINHSSLEAVISINFRLTDESETKMAHSFISRLIQRVNDAGYPPYRVDIENMDKMVYEDDEYWQLVRELKGILDPEEVISPGRYNMV